MKKRMGLLLMAVVLVTAALSSMPAMASGPLTCHPPACFIGPGCCTDAQCASFCQILNLGSTPHCSDPDGGCCSCYAEEIGIE
jgi:hypothetical protein